MERETIVVPGRGRRPASPEAMHTGRTRLRTTPAFRVHGFRAWPFGPSRNDDSGEGGTRPARGGWVMAFRASLRRVAAAAEEAVFGLVAGLVERRRLCPHLIDRGQSAGHRRAAVDRRDPRHQLGVIRFGGLAEEGADPARPGEGRDIGDRIGLTAEERYDAEPLFERGEHPADLRAV